MPDDIGHALPAPGTRRPARRRGSPRRGRARRPTQGQGKTKGDGSADAAKAADPGGLKFSQDIAPILVANCVGCHSGDGAGVRRGKLDLSTFEKLKKGTPDHKVVIAGKPEDSHLVLRINGEEEPKMPQGGNRALSAGGDRQDHPVGQGGCPARRRDRPQGGHGHLCGHPRAVASQAARPDAGQGARQEGHRGRAGSDGSSPMPSRSPRSCRARTSSCSATCPTTGPPAPSRRWRRNTAT